MAAREEQSQELVLEAAQNLRLRNRDARPRAQLREQVDRVAVALHAARAPPPITVGVLRDGHQPRFGGIGRPAAAHHDSARSTASWTASSASGSEPVNPSSFPRTLGYTRRIASACAAPLKVATAS